MTEVINGPLYKAHNKYRQPKIEYKHPASPLLQQTARTYGNYYLFNGSGWLSLGLDSRSV